MTISRKRSARFHFFKPMKIMAPYRKYIRWSRYSSLADKPESGVMKVELES